MNDYDGTQTFILNTTALLPSGDTHILKIVVIDEFGWEQTVKHIIHTFESTTTTTIIMTTTTEVPTTTEEPITTTEESTPTSEAETSDDTPSTTDPEETTTTLPGNLTPGFTTFIFFVGMILTIYLRKNKK